MKYYFKSKSKKYLLATILLLSLCPLLGLTYSSFIFSSNNYRASEMYIGSLLYSIKINDESVSEIKVKPGKTEIVIEVSSLNTVSTNYKIVYESNNNISIKYANDENEETYGLIMTKRKSTLQITNNSEEEITVKFNIMGGYNTNELSEVIIPDKYTEIPDNYTKYDINVISMYVGGKSVDELDDNKVYKLVDYSCTNGETVTYDNATNHLGIEGFNKKTKCTVYFEESNLLIDHILANDIAYRDDEASKYVNSPKGINFAEISSDTNGKGLYYTTNPDLTEDLDGDEYGEIVYYYRGAVENNNVVFGGFCWRIVRTNEDGSIRMRYNGTYENGTCPTTGTDVKINDTTYAFYESSDNEKYNEYIWEDGTGESLAKTTIDAWYISSGLVNYANQIANVPYCADKSNPTTGNKNYTFYGAANRLMDITTISAKSDAQPTYKCADIEDKHTVAGDSWGGNGKLSKPIGLLTADEVAFAGGRMYQSDGSSDNKTYYLYTSGGYWTMGPLRWTVSYATSFSVRATGSLTHHDVLDTLGLLPVISLKPEVTVASSGTGSYTNPYVVE